MSTVAEPGALRIARLGPADLVAFKSLRDEGLRLHPEAFDADLDNEAARPPESYVGRLGLSEAKGGTFLLGAWVGPHMVGMIGLERQFLPKLRHSAELNSMLVRPHHAGRGIGLSLMQECLAQARRANGLELITLRVSADNASAIRLYEKAGFKACGTVPRAAKLVDAQGRARYIDRLTMALVL
jgi:RimJ/RimL family protein N-acetyltransferase